MEIFKPAQAKVGLFYVWEKEPGPLEAIRQGDKREMMGKRAMEKMRTPKVFQWEEYEEEEKEGWNDTKGRSFDAVKIEGGLCK